MNKFLVFFEQRDGVVKKASMKVWNRVQEFAALSGGGNVTALLAGPADVQQFDGVLAGDGVIYHADEELFRMYNQDYWATLVSDMVKQHGFTAIFFADTTLSRDLAPRLSVSLRASLLSGSLIFNNQGLPAGCSRPVYSGLALASFVSERELTIYTVPLRGKVTSCTSGGRIEIVSYKSKPGTVNALFPVIQRTLLREEHLDVAEADIIVAGGRGMASRESFALLEQLADLLGGAVGASRFAVDEGWRPHADQVGQTGKTVSPRIYIACGISGALQHLAGIGSAGIVVAINSDADAPIFQVADYGIVGDVHVVLPKLIDAVKEFLKTK
jgi:electron transfer flavoprotein alpha subunit